MELTVIGGGLAGSEAAWQAAERGIPVRLVEMRPVRGTPAHQGADLAELVCSNSLGSMLPDRAAGLLQEECRRLRSLLLRCAESAAVPAGSALAVDRAAFARAVTRALESHPRVRVVREEAIALPDGPAVVATGPLSSPAFSVALQQLWGEEHLFFHDALAPIVEADSIDRSVVFAASRFGRESSGEGDYLNCPFDRPAYESFVRALAAARRVEPRPFERETGGPAPRLFEGCLPVEALAERGPDTLAFGPMRPVGLRDPRTGRRPHAVVQLRRENLAASLYNLVGFQTRLAFEEQDRVFRMIPGLESARFVRHGQMHRNTYLRSPGRISRGLECRERPGRFFAGQLLGVEGYMGSVATGLLAGINAARFFRGLPAETCPPETMIGSLCRHVAEADPGAYQPMKANLGLLPPLPEPAPRGAAKAAALCRRALESLPLDRLNAP